MVWSTLLRHAPAILSAAEALFLRSKTNRTDDHTRSIDARIDELVESSRASAQLMQDMAQQIQALTVAHEAMLRRARMATGLGIAASVIALVALLIAYIR